MNPPRPVITREGKMEPSPDQFPCRVIEKALKLLAAIERQTEFFGQTVRLNGSQYNLAYAKNGDEFDYLLNYLRDRHFVKRSNSTSGWDVAITGEGYAEIESRSLLPSLRVFVSSTCYDLLDLRQELAAHLESLGCIVRLSEDFDRFEVSGVEDAIETCLQNLDQSDIVICVLDRRYGWIVPSGPLQGKSVTHAEIERGRTLGKSIFFFVRDKAELDYRQLKKNPGYEPQWVEPTNPSDRSRWLEMVDTVFELPAEGRYSNWRDQFLSVVDMKKIVSKRVTDFQKQRAR